ncbi:transposable element Tcb2 transposase [Trichonephila clavipes]|nr:transposable element Tcb2 transposase [Trichonephila clavipes]
MLNGRTELHIFDRGSVTGDRYCEEVLLPHARLFRGAIGPDFFFMDGNARPHRTLAVDELLESEDITRMDCPAHSPDLNPIEHVWDALGRRIAARLHHPENTQQLKQMLIEEWARLPQEMLHRLVLSMRRRCEATIALHDHFGRRASYFYAMVNSGSPSGQSNGLVVACHKFEPSIAEDSRCRVAMLVKPFDAQMSFHWCSVEVGRGFIPRCRLRRFTIVRNYEVRLQKPLAK